MTVIHTAKWLCYSTSLSTHRWKFKSKKENQQVCIMNNVWKYPGPLLLKSNFLNSTIKAVSVSVIAKWEFENEKISSFLTF